MLVIELACFIETWLGTATAVDILFMWEVASCSQDPKMALGRYHLLAVIGAAPMTVEGHLLLKQKEVWRGGNKILALFVNFE